MFGEGKAARHLEDVAGPDGMGELGAEGGRDGVEPEVRAAVVDWHLPALPRVHGVAKALKQQGRRGHHVACCQPLPG